MLRFLYVVMYVLVLYILISGQNNQIMDKSTIASFHMR